MASLDYSIANIENIVKIDGKPKSVEVTRLTAPGENYLSLVLRVDLDIEKAGLTRKQSLVAKCLPLGERKHFEMHAKSMQNEIKWYCDIIPFLKSYAAEHEIEDVDIYPKYFGSRYSLDPSKTEPDSDSVLLLENLIVDGYQNEDRYIGCEFLTSKAILKSLAFFHAIPLAMKFNHPEKFKIIRDYIDSCRFSNFPEISKNDTTEKTINELENNPPEKSKESNNNLNKLKENSPERALLEVIDTIPGCTPYMAKLKELLSVPISPADWNKEGIEPWSTLSHNDFWVNNIMVKHIEGAQPLVKVVDFQMCGYKSYASDLVFFLLTSVRNDVQEKHLDELLRYYYNEFTSLLNKCNVKMEVSYSDYLEEIETAARDSEMRHAVVFSTIVFGEKGTGIDAAVEEFNPYIHFTNMIRNMNQYQKDKLVIMSSEGSKRNWI